MNMKTSSARLYFSLRLNFQHILNSKFSFRKLQTEEFILASHTKDLVNVNHSLYNCTFHCSSNYLYKLFSVRGILFKIGDTLSSIKFLLTSWSCHFSPCPSSSCPLGRPGLELSTIIAKFSHFTVPKEGPEKVIIFADKCECPNFKSTYCV